ncbi:uroporphyrinogen-III C-methyltransferase [Stenotrophomonas sp. YIM B06876]|uniref:uroporphyrinogen-III C-methyltransferase n=1 Tax=Stenotrophomonas sp. YIM B06876 TaxID=3060211 RepID=UPI00273A296D|nr:uroporphyrinogen-III C-methyltransferase [Stenotrophomonas sp. YIM B06876]
MNEVPAPLPPHRLLRRVAGVVALAALVAAGVSGYQAWHSRERQVLQLRQTTAEQLAAFGQSLEGLRRDQRANARAIQDAAATNRILRDELLGLSQRNALLEENFARLADHSRQGSQALRQEEAELLLSQAQQRLVFAGDLDGARRLYALAAAALEGIDLPGYLNLRQALIQERHAVDALGPGVRASAEAQLDHFARALHQLPDAAAAASGRGTSPWWQQLLSPLVQIRPADGNVLVAHSERIAAADSLQIELSLARAALERGDTRGYRRALDRVAQWLPRLWPDSPALRQRQAELRTLRDTDLQPLLPELGSTLQQLRALRAGRTP